MYRVLGVQRGEGESSEHRQTMLLWGVYRKCLVQEYSAVVG